MDIRRDVAGGNSLRSPNASKNTVVFGPTVFELPLLPYEKQLIETIGLTEDDYRRFTAEVRRRGAIRPADYDHIPDIQNALVTSGAVIASTYLTTTAAKSATAIVLTNIAVGVVLTGAAFLLTPKPKAPEARKAGGTINLDSITGASRFSPSSGFDSISELATYAASIPIIFGLRRSGIGGMFVTPKMVWSRMFSHGTMQQAKLLFVVGEQGVGSSGIASPDLEGIFLGNNVLDPLFEQVFAFYWKADSTTARRVRIGDRQYGTIKGLDSGDPDARGSKRAEAFLAPTEDDMTDQAFCHTFSPANNTQFGIYSPIANGTGYRVNYRVVSIPDDQEGKAKQFQTISRIKIVGDRNKLFKNKKDVSNNDLMKEIRNHNQSGLGRNYSPRMGLVKLKRGGTNFTVSGNLGGSPRLTQSYRVQKDDELEFFISPTEIPKDFYKDDGKGESVEDINSTIESAQLAADEALQLGEQFEIGGCVWVVTKRKEDRYEPQERRKPQVITLKCISVSESIFRRVGLVDIRSVVNPRREYIGDSPEDGFGGQGNSDERVENVSELWYPLTRVAHATIRNNRPAVSTEIGIKSVVNQRLNGLCAFNSLPSPNEIDDFDKDNFQVNTGTINSFIPRTIIFRVFVRDSDKSLEFRPVPLLFAVKGETPVAQYNFIRFVNRKSIGDNGAARLEFKIVQVSGSDARRLPGQSRLIELTHSASPGLDDLLSITVKVNRLGEMTVYVAGREVEKRSFEDNKEFFRNPTFIEGSTTFTYPNQIRYRRQVPAPKAGFLALAVSKRGGYVSNISTRKGEEAAFTEAIAGNSDNSPVPVKGKSSYLTVRTKEYPHSGDHPNGVASRWIKVAYVLRKRKLPNNHYARQSGRQTYWKLVRVIVEGSSLGYNPNQIIELKRGIEATDVLSNPTSYSQQNNSFVANHPDGTLTFSGARYRITRAKKIDRADGRDEAYLYELFGNPENLPRGRNKTVTQTVTKGSKTIKFKLRSSVRRLSKSQQKYFDRKQTWSKPEIVQVVEAGTSQTWNVRETFEHRLTAQDANPFRTVYGNPGIEYQISSRNKVVVDDRATSLAKFATNTQISDISFYRQLVDKSNASQPESEVVYINEVQEYEIDPPSFANLTLAGLSLKAGRSFTRLDQLRVYLKSGIPVERLHPQRRRAYGDNDSIGPSNLLTDLFYYLMTDQIGGAGALLGQTRNQDYLVDKNALIQTSKFLQENKLFFNGPITDRSNLRQMMMDLAPSFLCNLVITNGKFALKPALPVKNGGALQDGPVPIEQLFTSGNILEDTFKIEYLRAEERRVFKAVVRYREETLNQFPEEKAITVTGLGREYNQNFVTDASIEQFDLTQFCTSQEHAELVAKYFLSLRKLVTHTISFSTTVEGLSIQAGSFIKVITESSPYSSANNGTISATGVVTSVDELDDGKYTMEVNEVGSEEINTFEGVQVRNGRVVNNPDLRNSVFTLVNRSVSQNVYIVEQLTFSQEGTVDIVASEHPCDDDGASKLVDSILDDNFRVE